MLCFLTIPLFLLVTEGGSALQNRTFVVDYEKGIFLKDGKPFSYISGEIHYFRIPQQYWRDRLEKVKAAGIDTISTYVEWSLHEPARRVYNFFGDTDLFVFLDIARELGFNVILRPGPYICAERGFGGYPAWLLTQDPNILLRTSDQSYTTAVKEWFDVLMPKLFHYFYGNGGPIIMVQVENEYGSYAINDQLYLIWLRDLLKSYVREAAVLFTTDGSDTKMIKRGRIPGVLTTIDFGPTKSSVMKNFKDLKKIQPNGPLVCSEYYVGWISYWGKKWSYQNTQPIIKNIKELIANNVSFNMYMMHGGTNFGFSSGSGGDKEFEAVVTSYDYDAPISEAGDLTYKYNAIREVINKNINDNVSLPQDSEKGEYGVVYVSPICTLFNCSIGTEYSISEGLVTFEQLNQPYGFVSYSTVVNVRSRPSVLWAKIRDRAVVYINHKEVGIFLYKEEDEITLPTVYEDKYTLTLLVENMGRRNYKFYGLLDDCAKGMISNPTINGLTLSNWTVMGFPFNPPDIAKLESVKPTTGDIPFPAVFRGYLLLEDGEDPKDTFIFVYNWGKGMVFVNGHCLGRYWNIGPQQSLYVPAPYLQPYPAKNTITLVELHHTNSVKPSVIFLPAPVINN